MECEEFKMRLPAPAAKVCDVLESAGKPCYAVGGCVRDAVLGRAPHDWDFATSATVEDMHNLLDGAFRLYDTGVAHGTVTVESDGEMYEFTTFRVDSDYSDGRHPDSVSFSKNIEDDLARRDFTVNAMAWSRSGGLVDPYGGREDLCDNVLRCVGDPDKRFSEDGLRVMRAVRFEAVYGFKVEPKTHEAMLRHLDRLKCVSRERVGNEFAKMMMSDGERTANALLAHKDVVFALIPELAVTDGYDQSNPYHDKPLYEHLVETVRQTPPVLRTRLAALLHDVAKPSCRVLDSAGTAHYNGHMAKGADLASDVLKELRFPSSVVSDVAFMVSVHDKRIDGADRSVRRAVAECGGDVELFEDLLDLRFADVLAHEESAYWRLDDIAAALATERRLLEEDACFKLKDLAVNGDDLMELGYEQGRALGAELSSLFSAVLDGRLPNERNALLEAASENM